MATSVGVAATTVLLLCIYRWLMRRPVKPPNTPANAAEARGEENRDTLIRGDDGESVESGSQESDIQLKQPYNVFLCFRGKDTRDNFTDVLHHHMDMAELRVFKDDDELAIGDKIDFSDAIRHSEICVPIFSETFAESKWCLDEVKKMVESNKKIVPIFYKVSVDDVKLKTQKYKRFMKKHEKTHGKEKVNEWEAALRKAINTTGREYCNKGYTQFCKIFIKEVLDYLGPRDKVHPDVLIGVEDQINRFQKLLDLHSSAILYICIHGMGGIGKTALSKVIFKEFSRRFHGWKFIDVSQNWSDPDKRSKLKEELKNYTGKSKQRQKKLLIVLDNVDQCKQIEELAGQHIGYCAGSVIIVTTREEDILRKCNGLADGQIISFEMDFLQPQDALRLFCIKAFHRDTPPDDFKSLSNEVVAITGGLPLSLIYMGSDLCGLNKNRWEANIKRSKDILDKEVKKVLKISYDELDVPQKQIFLDLACLPICRTEPSRMMAMWEACKFHPYDSLLTLESNSLIKIQGIDRDEPSRLKLECKNYRIWIHIHYRDLGRDIISDDGSLPPTKCSRLWQDEAYNVLTKQKVDRKKVQALSLGNLKMDDLCLCREKVGSLENLRFLHHDDGFQSKSVSHEGDLDDLFPNLRYLRLYLLKEFNGRNFSLPNLVTLDLSRSNVNEEQGGWASLFQGGRSLKEMILSECNQLKRTPYFPENMHLEILDLNHCKNLVTLHDSIGNLKCLKYLYIRGTGIEELPPSIGKLESLIVLDLRDTPIQVLPSSISALEKLEQLLADDSNLREIPELPPNLHKLCVLSQTLEKICDICRLNHLVYLTLVGGYQVATSNLDAIEKFFDLKSLELRLDLPEDVVLQINFSHLSHLENLQLSCQNFKDVPLQLPSCLSSLKLWHIRSNAQFCSLPPSLNKLTLSECPSLILVGGLHFPQSIEDLEFDDCGLQEKLPDLSGCKNLRKLRVNRCIRLMQVSIPRDLKSLISLNIEKCISLEKIEGLFQLENLQDIKIDDYVLTRDTEELGDLHARRQGGNLLMGKWA